MDDRIKEGGAYPEVGRLFSENATCGDYPQRRETDYKLVTIDGNLPLTWKNFIKYCIKW